jgi:chromosome segregation ATPase
VLLSSSIGVLPAHGADEDQTARVKEMLHRTQEALRQAQSDNAELARAKADAERKLEAATGELAAQQNGAKTTQAALSAKLTAVEGGRSVLEGKLQDAQARLAAANLKLSETNQELAARAAELAEAKSALDRSTASITSCEAKNLTLYGYAQELLDRYKKKGVWAALAQKEPVFGFKEVGVENVLQEYQLKVDAQKLKP